VAFLAQASKEESDIMMMATDRDKDVTVSQDNGLSPI